jgi:2-polyprenyl-3-methyl-5-hydroxy-6-metoxy-1,4-benzoquinol methylase
MANHAPVLRRPLTATSDAKRGRRKPLGSVKSLVDSRLVFRLYRRLFGAEDMHSHYRWAAVSPLISRSAERTLEVGGGDGRISFELASEGYEGAIVMTEFDPVSVAEAEAIKAAGEFTQVEVSQKDLRQLGMGPAFHQVLAIDVLEHIDDDTLAIQEISQALVPGGRLVLSVPTPLYKRRFGQKFHDHLGHVRDGYYLEDLDAKLADAGLIVEAHRYYTGTAVGRAAWLFYASGIPYFIGALWAPFARPFLRRTEKHVAREHAASLALVAVKVA